MQNLVELVNQKAQQQLNDMVTKTIEDKKKELGKDR